LLIGSFVLYFWITAVKEEWIKALSQLYKVLKFKEEELKKKKKKKKHTHDFPTSLMYNKYYKAENKKKGAILRDPDSFSLSPRYVSLPLLCFPVLLPTLTGRWCVPVIL
jgi:hypothetical protein